MTTQAAMIMDTVLGMKRTLANDEASDSDDPYLQPSNRGNKLKRKAHQQFTGPHSQKRGRTSYTRTIEHAGFRRDILRFNPKRYDEDGDELDSEDEDAVADARAAEENPYAGIKLESLLAPLTSAANLPDHPSLSDPYLSSTLSDMAYQACQTIQRERKTLESAKLLFVKMRGDEPWLPTEHLNASDDDDIFDTSHVFERIISTSSAYGQNGVGKEAAANGIAKGIFADQDFALPTSAPRHDAAEGFGAASDKVDEPQKTNGSPGHSKAEDQVEGEPGEKPANHVNDGARDENTREKSSINGEIKTNGEAGHGQGDGPTFGNSLEGTEHADQEPKKDDATRLEASGPTQQGAQQSDNLQPAKSVSEENTGEADEMANSERGPDDMDIDADGGSHVPRRMRTRAQAHAASEPAESSRSPSVEPTYVPPAIHPIFLIPALAKPDANYGLTAPEAEETRRMLLIYVQKQEEVCRNAEQLYKGLLKADRLRRTVFKWCKAEGHVGEMSDGEDWYDKEEWGLEDDLRKGEADDRVADDDVGAQGKKTRGRRA